jgi:haloacetate dehalogenase
MSTEAVRVVQAADTSFLVREPPGTPPAGSTPVLLLHGVPETSSLWREVGPRLAPGRRVLAPDLPGLGGSTYTGPFDVPSLVAQLAALVEAEVPGGRVDVVGHDWGGLLALGLAGARPDLVRRLVVANAPFREVPLLRAAHVPFFALPLAPELLFRLGGRRLVDLMLAAAWKSDAVLDPESRAEYQAAYTTRHGVTAMLGYYRAAARPKVWAALTRSTAEAVPRVQVEKALVLWGALDPVLPLSVGEGVVRDLGADATMVTVPGAGHFVVEEATDVVVQVLLDALADDTTPVAPVPAAAPELPHAGPIELGPIAEQSAADAPAPARPRKKPSSAPRR